MPNWLKDAVFYEIYPQSFYDTNGDGIGDLEGIIEKLDYVKSLGCNAIWINPCFESPFQDAGYDITDYCKIAPRYGTNSDMKRLFDEAHKRGMHILLDLVPGHTSDKHPWFKECCKAERNKYSDRYVWDETPKGDFGRQPSQGTRPGGFYPNFAPFQPSLNYGFYEPDPAKPWQFPTDHPSVLETKEELKNIMRFWLDMGADGYRVDMAHSLVKNDNDGHKGTIALWQDVRRMLDSEYPEAAMVSEWSIPNESITAGFHMDFYLHFNSAGYSALFDIDFMFDENNFFSSKGKGNIRTFTDEYDKFYEETKGKGYICIPTSNHDMARRDKSYSKRQREIAFSFIYAMPGVPFLYYGDEIGMSYNDDVDEKEGGMVRTGSRTPMQWNKTKNAGFSSASEDDIYLPVEEGPDFPNVADEQREKDSLLNFTKAAIKRRKDNPALGNDGAYRTVYAEENKYPYIFERSGGGQRLIVAVNPAAKEATAEIDVALLNNVIFSIGDLPAVNLSGSGCTIKLAPESFAIYTL